MKLISCSVANFGKLSDKVFRFSPGMNIFRLDNGEGKTTLTVFLKSMFYGLDDTKKTALAENDRRHYLPWQGGAFGGMLTFEANGRRYRIERSFGPKASEDTFSLYNSDTGLPSHDFSAAIGEELFGIDADGFERTVFLSERNLSGKNTNPSISAKLSDLVGADADVGNFDEAKKSLENLRKFYYKKGDGGEIGRLREEIRGRDLCIARRPALEEKAHRIAETLAEKRGLLKEKQALLLDRRKESEAAVEQKLRDGYAAQARGMALALQKKKERLEELSAFFAAGVPDREDLRRAENALAATVYAKPTGNTTLDAMKSRFSSVKEEELRSYTGRAAKLSAERAALSEKRTSAAPLPLTLFLVLSGLVLLLGLFVGAAVSPFGFAILLLEVPLLVLLLRRQNTLREEKEREEKLRELDAEEGRIRDYLATLGYPDSVNPEADLQAAGVLFARFQLLSEQETERERQADEVREGIRRAHDTALAFVRRYPTVTDRPFAEIADALDERRSLSAAVSAGEAELAEYMQTHGLGTEDLTEKPAVSAEKPLFGPDPAEEIRAMEQEMTLLVRESEDIDTALEDIEDQVAARDADAEALLKAEHRYEIIRKCSDFLDRAKTALNARYLSTTKEGLRHYLSLIARVDEEMYLDTDFSVSKAEQGKTRAAEAFSRGTRDLFGIAVRLALADALFAGEEPFLLFDDPFCALDDKKCEAALRLLYKIGETRQVLYFTCSASRTL